MPRRIPTSQNRSRSGSNNSRQPPNIDLGMRVTHVITRLIVGGAQENTVASVLGLRSKPGLEVNLISGPTTAPEGSIESLVAPALQLLTIVPELVRPVHPWYALLALPPLTA